MPVRAAKTALQVLEAVADRQPCGLSELSRHLGIHKATVQRALTTLAEERWIRLDNQDIARWVLTGRALSVGSKVAASGGLREVALPVMNRLQADVGETIHLTVPDYDEIVLIERLDSAQAVRVSLPVGVRYPLHNSANAEAVLAYLPEHEVEERLTCAMEKHPQTDPDMVRSALRGVRRRGYAVAESEIDHGVAVVAASIRPPKGRPVGAIAICAPRARLPRRLHREYGEKVITAAAEISAALPFSGR